MSEELFFVKLREILVYLYPEEADARRVVNNAGMDGGNISFSTKAINNWTTILLQADKENKTANLMAVTFRDYKENEKLSKGWYDYLVTLRNREVTTPSEPLLNRNVRWSWVMVSVGAGILFSVGLISGLLLPRWFPSTFSSFILPSATATTNSSVFQPTAFAAISPTKIKSVATFTTAPKASEMPVSLQVPTLTKTPTLPISPETNTPPALLTNISIATAAEMHTPIATVTISPTTTPKGSNATTTPIVISPSLGLLSVTVPEQCGAYNFDIKIGDKIVGQDQTGKKKLVAQGTYDIVLTPRFGTAPVRRDVEVREGEESVVDFSSELGILWLASYPQLKQLITYNVSQDNVASRIFLVSDYHQCGSSGIYTIQFATYQSSSSPFGGSSVVWYALFGNEGIAFDVEIKPGETTIIEPSDWPKEPGLITFRANSSFEMTLEIHQIIKDEQVKLGDKFALYSTRSYWMLPGTYNITFLDPYVNFMIPNFEIKARAETVLELPDLP